MLPAASRVRRSADFTGVLRSGRRAGRGPLVVHILIPANEPVGPTRAGFVVGRAVGNAVARNRTRRRLRHLVAQRLSTVPAGATVVVRALAGAGDLSSPQLAGHLDAVLLRLNPKVGPA